MTDGRSQTTGWQPISSAPKTDGKVVLIWHHEIGAPALAYYSMGGWVCVAFGEIACHPGEERAIKPADYDVEPELWMEVANPDGSECAV